MDANIYPTHNNGVRPYFGELSIPPPLKENRLVHDHQASPTKPTPPTHARRATISDILNPVFISTHQPYQHKRILDNPDTTFLIAFVQTNTMDLDCNLVYFTVTKKVNSMKKLQQAHQEAFAKSKSGEIYFLLKHEFNPIHIEKVPDGGEI